MGLFSKFFGEKNKENANTGIKGQELYEKGLQHWQNRKRDEALKCYALAAEKEYGPAWYEMARIYTQGDEVKQDYKKAVEYFSLSLECGSIGAYSNLAHHYLNGLGVERDVKKGLEYLKMGAEKGDVGSQCNLGSMYLDKNCPYLDQDINQAVEWLQFAASNNSCHAAFDAQYKLGCVHYLLSADGFKVDKVFDAKRWFNLAAENGHTDAKQMLNKLFSKKHKINATPKKQETLDDCPF
jgi:uncharacterized protein